MRLGIDYLAIPGENEKWNGKEFVKPDAEYYPVYLDPPVLAYDSGDPGFRLYFRYKCPWCGDMSFGFKQMLKHMGKVPNVEGSCQAENAYTKLSDKKKERK